MISLPPLDVIVAGGGPSGSAAAMTLARRGLRVLLADAQASSSHPGESLPPAALPMLRDLGVTASTLEAQHLVSYGTCSSWGAREVHGTDFLRSPHGLGYHLDRPRFDAFLRAMAVDAGVTLVDEARIVVRPDDAGGVTLLRGSDELRVAARRLVDATGRRAVVARGRGARRVAHDRLVAFVGRMRGGRGTRADHETRTLVEAVADGWWYSARIPSGERIVAFLTDADLAPAMSLLDGDTFTEALGRTAHVSALVNDTGYALSARVRGGDASSRALDSVTGVDWVAVGDAALAVDPLSSQGITNALYTGLMAGRAVAASIEGDAGAMARYVAQLGRVAQAYRTNLRAVYALETRWRDSPFWRRRHRGSLETRPTA